MNEPEIKYREDGQAFNVIEKTRSGYLVNHIYAPDDYYDFDESDTIEDEDGEKWNIDPNVIYLPSDQIFNRAPTARYDKQIVQLEKSVSDLQQKKTELKVEIANILEQQGDQLAKFKQYEQLKQLEDFIDGKVTHYLVAYWNIPYIIAHDDTGCEYGKGREKRLLSLFGSSNGDLSWEINEYRDGSGSWIPVIPFTSEEAAKVALVKEFRSRKTSEQLIDGAIKHGIELDPEKLKAFNDKKKQRVRGELKIAEDQCKSYKATLEGME